MKAASQISSIKQAEAFQTLTTAPALAIPVRRPRLGFLGVGWIGRHRLEAIERSGAGEVVAIADTAGEHRDKALEAVPRATGVDTLRELLDLGLDGVVIATPSALHAEQALAAIDAGVAVFCQKPLGRDGSETSRVVEAAKAANVLLGVDLSYRFISGVRQIAELCRSGKLGRIFAVDLEFHNAYGPDKPWFYDRRLSGGGCVIDLGIHLVDLALWVLGFTKVINVSAKLFAKGQHLRGLGAVEDFAEARIDLANGTCIRLACSWKLHAGKQAEIQAKFYGTNGGAAFHNLDGSFYNFQAERFSETRTEVLTAAPEPWGGRAAVAWARQLADNPVFDPGIESLKQVALVLDEIYRQGSQ